MFGHGERDHETVMLKILCKIFKDIVQMYSSTVERVTVYGQKDSIWV